MTLEIPRERLIKGEAPCRIGTRLDISPLPLAGLSAELLSSKLLKTRHLFLSLKTILIGF